MVSISLILLVLFSLCAFAQEEQASGIGLAKELASLDRQADGNATITYRFVIANVGETLLADLSLIDALRTTIPNPAEFTVIEITSTDFAVNTAYDGTSDLELLAAGNELEAGATGTIDLVIEIIPNADSARYENSAVVYGTDSEGQRLSDTSTSGQDPDPDLDGDPTNNAEVTKASFSNWTLGGVVEFDASASETDPLTVDGVSFSAFATLGDFSVSLNAGFTQFAADSMNIDAAGMLGNIRFNSSLALDITSASFVSWQAGAAFKLMDVDFTDIVSVTTPQTASYNQFSWSAQGDLVSVQGALKVGICPLAFLATNICATVDWPECDTSFTGCITFDCDNGFSLATLSLADYKLFEDFMGVTGSISATISYAIEDKSVSVSLNLTPDWFICPEIDLLAEFNITPTTPVVNSVLIYGIKGECPIGPATFRFAESLSAAKNSSVTGKAAYFERLGVSAEIPGCCGPASTIDIDSYFERTPSGTLFSWGLLTASAEIHLFDGFSVSFDLEFAKDAPHWGFAVSTKVFW